MNLLKKTLLTLAIAFSAGAAHADIILDTVAASSVGNPDVTTSHSVVFSHDITDGANGYVFGTDKILSAVITISLIDPNNGNENFSFTIGSGNTSQIYPGQNINNGSQAFPYPVTLTTSLADLVADGLLSVTLSASAGDYRFVSSTLSATVQHPVKSSEAPEPASIALLGLGMLSFAASRRKLSK